MSIPAEIRRRWATATVRLQDLGNRIILMPAPDDPIAAARGALADEFGSISTQEMRRQAREDDEAAIERRRIL